MRWTKVRKLVEESFAESVRGRVTLHVTNGDTRGVRAYGRCTFSWIRVDHDTVAYLDRHACMFVVHARRFDGSNETIKTGLVYPFSNEAPAGTDYTDDVMDLSLACWDYLHAPIADSLASADPFVQSLAVLSARVGRSRLRRLESQALHPLVETILQFRLKAEAEQRAARSVAIV